MNATVTIQLNDLDKLRKDLAMRDKLIEGLREEVHAARAYDPTNKVTELYAAVQAALPVVRFAVANLPPEMSPGWPYLALHSIGTMLQTIPGATVTDIELGLELVSMSREIAPFEQARARGERHPARVG